MDEEKKGFSIPPKKSIFDEPAVDSVEVEAMDMGATEFVASFGNADGTKAVNVAAIETDDEGNFVATLDNAEMDEYAQGLMNGEADDRNLQVGDIYEGEKAMEDAMDDAEDLNEKFAPMPDASDEEKAKAINDAKAKAKIEGYEDEIEKDYEDIEEEPMLKQMKGEKPEIGGGFGKMKGKEKPMGVEDLALPIGEEM